MAFMREVTKSKRKPDLSTGSLHLSDKPRCRFVVESILEHRTDFEDVRLPLLRAII